MGVGLRPVRTGGAACISGGPEGWNKNKSD